MTEPTVAAAAARIAPADRSTSSSLVRQFETEIRIAALPCQTVPESQKIVGLACFYNEKVDRIIDGVRQERPRSPFS